MSKRFQIPSDEEDQRLYREAARKQGIAAAEWARRILRTQARKELKSGSLQSFLDELDRKFGATPDWEVPERMPSRPVEDWTK